MNILLLFAAVVLIFTGLCVLRFIDVVRQSRAESELIKQWWRERAERRKSETNSGPRAA